MPVVELQTKQCPFCAETIQARAIKCRYCGEFLNTDRAKALQAGPGQDSQPDKDEEKADNVLFAARPSMFAVLGAAIKSSLIFGIAVVMFIYPLEIMLDELLGVGLSDNQLLVIGKYRVMGGAGLAVLVVLMLLIKIIRLKMIYYEVTPNRVEYSRGILDREVDNLDMFRVIDLRMHRSLLDCVLGIGTVVLLTTDKTDPEFVFQKIRHSRRLYDIIKKASLDADQRNRVIHLE